MPNTPEEILQRIIDRNLVKAEIIKADAAYGDYIKVEYKGKTQRYKLGQNSSSFNRNG